MGRAQRAEVQRAVAAHVEDEAEQAPVADLARRRGPERAHGCRARRTRSVTVGDFSIVLRSDCDILDAGAPGCRPRRRPGAGPCAAPASSPGPARPTSSARSSARRARRRPSGSRTRRARWRRGRRVIAAMRRQVGLPPVGARVGVLRHALQLLAAPGHALLVDQVDVALERLARAARAPRRCRPRRRRRASARARSSAGVRRSG